MTGLNRPLFDEDPTLPPAPALEFGKTPPPAAPTPHTGAGLEELGPRDLGLPQLKIRQPLTPNADGVPEGSYFVTADPAFHSIGRDVVVLEVRKERSLMLPYAGGPSLEAVVQRIAQRTGVEVPLDWDDGPVCFSHDRVRPVELEGLPVLSDTCADCPMNRWRTVKGRRSQDCAESYRLLAYDVVTQRPCVFYARGSAIRPTRELLAQLQSLCERHQRPAYGFGVYMLTRRVEGTDGPYFVPVFQGTYLLEDSAQISFYAAVRQKLASAPVEGV